MTGYASASAAAASQGPAGPAVTVELRSVNGRFLDLAFRLPEELRSLEPALRELIAARVRRGKVELRITTARDDAAGFPQPAPEQVNRLLMIESSVQSWLPNARPLSVGEVLQWCRNAAPPAKLDEAALGAARRAVEGLAQAREREGARLTQMLRERLQRLRELAALAEPLVGTVVQRQQQRFIERWHEITASVNAGAALPIEALHERALAEAASFALRIDVAEELARLRSHVDEIERLLAQGGEVGKRLDFQIQELQREANTLGSKSAALDLTQIAVEMKVTVEQLREQVQNLE
jgi:uncharacterized protein (TIGR00255 family)